MATGLIIGSGEVSLPGAFERIGGLDTPYGPASDGFFKGQVRGQALMVSYRHGEPRRLAPPHHQHRAKLWLLKFVERNRLMRLAGGGIVRALRPGIWPHLIKSLTTLVPGAHVRRYACQPR